MHKITTKLHGTNAGSMSQAGSLQVVDLQNGSGEFGSFRNLLFNWSGSAWVQTSTFTPGSTKALCKVTYADGTWKLIGEDATNVLYGKGRNGTGIAVRFTDTVKTKFVGFPLTGVAVDYGAYHHFFGDVADAATFVTSWNGLPVATNYGITEVDEDETTIKVFPRVTVPLKPSPKLTVNNES